MGKAETTTEAMEHIASIVNEVADDISVESEKLLKNINLIQDKTNSAIKDSECQISLWQDDIRDLEAEIAYYQSMEDEEYSYQPQIEACKEQINEMRSRIRKERLRNNELRRTLSQFCQQSAQTLKTVKQTNLAVENANTGGKQYIAKKTNILSSGYHKDVVGVTAMGAGLGLLSHAADAGSEHSLDGVAAVGGNGPQASLPIKDFGNDINAAQAWGDRAYQSWNDSLSITERQALIDYKKELDPHESSYYVNINNTLRGKDSFSNGNKMRYLRIHSALSRSSVPSDVIAYRAVSRQAYDNMAANARLAGGDGLRDNGFMSCSLVPDNEFTNTHEVIMRLVIPEGSRGAYLGNVGSEFANECELLLDCGSTIFITNTMNAPRSTITGNPESTDMITIVDGVVD